MASELEKLYEELALNKQKLARYEMLADRSFEAITIYDDQLVCVDTNIQSTNLFQYTRDEIIGMKGLDFFAPESKDGILKRVKDEYNKPYEALMMRKDGSTFWGLIQGTTIDIDGTIHRVSTCRDISDLKSIQDQLEAKNQEFETIFSNSQAGIALLDGERIVQRTNEEVARMFGYDTPEDMIGLDLKDLHVSEKNYKKFGEFYREALIERRNVKLDIQLKHKTGDPFWVNVSGTVVDKFDPPDLSKGIVWAIIDIGGRKEMEMKLKEQNEELHALNEELKTLNDNKDKFISILAHDIKSPLSGALSLSELLIEEFDSFDKATLKDQFQSVSDSIRKTYSLLGEILFWIKSQLGRMSINLVDVEFLPATQAIIDQLKSSANDKKIEISCFSSEDLVVKADEDMFKTILRNLITNAIKFTNQGGKISIYARREAQHAIISVSDNGVGIKSEHIPKLWEFSEDVSTFGTENETGTGMGLVLCKELVTNLGGEIWVKSILGKGSEFSFTLPLVFL